MKLSKHKISKLLKHKHKGQTRKLNKNIKHKTSYKSRTFRNKKKYVNLRTKTLKKYRGGFKSRATANEWYRDFRKFITDFNTFKAENSENPAYTALFNKFDNFVVNPAIANNISNYTLEKDTINALQNISNQFIKENLSELNKLPINIPSTIMKKSVVPEVAVPEVAVPEVAAPEVAAPEEEQFVAPEAEVPEVAAPEEPFVAPEVAAPEEPFVAPEVAAPEVAAPEVVVPEVVVPEEAPFVAPFVAPEEAAPEVAVPEIAPFVAPLGEEQNICDLLVNNWLSTIIANPQNPTEEETIEFLKNREGLVTREELIECLNAKNIIIQPLPPGDVAEEVAEVAEEVAAEVAEEVAEDDIATKLLEAQNRITGLLQELNTVKAQLVIAAKETETAKLSELEAQLKENTALTQSLDAAEKAELLANELLKTQQQTADAATAAQEQARLAEEAKVNARQAKFEQNNLISDLQRQLETANDEKDDKTDKGRAAAEEAVRLAGLLAIEKEKLLSAERLVSEKTAIAEQAKVEAEKARAEAEQAKADAEQAKAEAEKAKSEAEKAKSEAEKARAEAEQAKSEAQAKAKAQAEKAEAEAPPYPSAAGPSASAAGPSASAAGPSASAAGPNANTAGPNANTAGPNANTAGPSTSTGTSAAGPGPLPKISVQNDSNNKITIRIEVPKNFTHDIAAAGGDDLLSTINVLPENLNLDLVGGRKKK